MLGKEEGKGGGIIYMKGALGEYDNRFESDSVVRILSMVYPGVINRGGVHRDEVFSGVGKLTGVELSIGIGPSLPGAVEALVSDRIYKKAIIELHGGMAAKGEGDTKTKVMRSDTFLDFKLTGMTFIFSKEGIETLDDTSKYFCILKIGAQYSDVIQKRTMLDSSGAKKGSDVLGISTTKDTAKIKGG